LDRIEADTTAARAVVTPLIFGLVGVLGILADVPRHPQHSAPGAEQQRV
jgi:hypothetical protein